MARQKAEDNLFYGIFRVVPTWATALIVVLSYPVLRYLLPTLSHGSLCSLACSTFAPYFTFLLALIALGAELDKYKRRRLVSQNSSLNTLREMTWQEFEQLVGEVYRQQGYRVEETGRHGPDGGIDLILRRHTETVLVQCKQWKSQQVGVKPLRELRGVVSNEKAARGIFVTCSGYTRAALGEAGGQPPLELVDGDALQALIQQAQGQTTPAQKTSITTPDVIPVPPLCPQCGKPMLTRTSRTGVTARSQFWGCAAFPKCRGTRPR